MPPPPPPSGYPASPAPVAPVPPGGGGKTPLIIIAAVVALALIGAGVFLATRSSSPASKRTPSATAAPEATATPSGATHTLTVVFGLYDSASVAAGCVSQGSYADITADTTLTLKNASGAVIGTKALGQPHQDNTAGACIYTAKFTNVPDQDSYGLTLANHGDLTYSRSELQAKNWEADVKLGQGGATPSP
jgi:hypothetical protein